MVVSSTPRHHGHIADWTGRYISYYNVKMINPVLDSMAVIIIYIVFYMYTDVCWSMHNGRKRIISFQCYISIVYWFGQHNKEPW